jgi:hypothetical protein
MIRIGANILNVILVLGSFTMFAQEKFENRFFRDITIDFGIYPSLTSGNIYPEQFGSILSISSAHYLMPKTGYRIGLTVLSDMEGSHTVYSVPIYFTYRTSTRRTLDISSSTGSINDLLTQLFMSIFPKNAEFNIGTNLGITSPDGIYSYIIIDGTPYANYFDLTNRFVASIDGGFRLNYKIWRFAVCLSPAISYLVTQNYKFTSTILNDPSNGYKPDWYFRGTVGVSFSF